MDAFMSGMLTEDVDSPYLTGFMGYSYEWQAAATIRRPISPKNARGGAVVGRPSMRATQDELLAARMLAELRNPSSTAVAPVGTPQYVAWTQMSPNLGLHTPPRHPSTESPETNPIYTAPTSPNGSPRYRTALQPEITTTDLSSPQPNCQTGRDQHEAQQRDYRAPMLCPNCGRLLRKSWPSYVGRHMKTFNCSGQMSIDSIDDASDGSPPTEGQDRARYVADRPISPLYLNGPDLSRHGEETNPSSHDGSGEGPDKTSAPICLPDASHWTNSHRRAFQPLPLPSPPIAAPSNGHQPSPFYPPPSPRAGRGQNEFQARPNYWRTRNSAGQSQDWYSQHPPQNQEYSSAQGQAPFRHHSLQ